MNREQAKQFHIVGVADRMRYEMFVDHIFNDWESQVCLNCKFRYDEQVCDRVWAKPGDDGFCEDFERKDK